MVQHLVISGVNVCHGLKHSPAHEVPSVPASSTSRPQRQQRRKQGCCHASTGDSDTDAFGRRSLIGAGLALSTAAQLQLPQPASASIISKDWEKVALEVDPAIVLLDIGFEESNPKHGFLLGSRQTLLETKDSGKTWAPRSIAAAREEGFNYRLTQYEPAVVQFVVPPADIDAIVLQPTPLKVYLMFTGISFAGAEGWIVGKPAILLHTTDGGANWERVPLSSKLPGNPVLVKAISGKAGQAEMTTDQGAVYVTDNAAYTWSAAVQETVDATLNRTVSSGISGASYYEGTFSNINRSPAGEYVAVSSRGNFYLTWSPGQTFWQPHNRPSARRVQNMGWTPTNTLWLATRGGDVYFGSDRGAVGSFDQAKLGSRGFGILDVGFLDQNLGFACGGSGTLFRTDDGGKSWKRDRATDDIAGNLYAIKFFPQSDNGFILGNAGILLRYIA